MSWQFLLQRQDTAGHDCWLRRGEPLLPGVYRLWGRTSHPLPGAVTVEWFWPTATGRSRWRRQVVTVNRRGVALLLPWRYWEPGTYRLRCWTGEKPSRIWESWGDGLSWQVTTHPCLPAVLALHWRYRCQFPWHQTLHLRGWARGGQALALQLQDPLQPALVLHLQQPLAAGDLVPFCFEVAIPTDLYQRVLLGRLTILETSVYQELLLVNPLVPVRLTPELRAESCSLAELAQQAKHITQQLAKVFPTGAIL